MRKLASSRSPASASPPRVAVLVETSTSWGRGIIRGVGNYVQAHEPWRLAIEPLGIDQPVRFPADWPGEGVIARINTPSLAQRLTQTGLPVVNVSGVVLPHAQFPRVTTDEHLIAQLAVTHLKDRGFRQFAYCGEGGQGFARRRADIFARVVEAAGLEYHAFKPQLSSRHRVWDTQNQALIQWLAQLPRPVGILAWSALSARRVAQACLASGLAVPDDAAIIGVDTDDLLGEVVRPSLSGVRLAVERSGYEAAALLARMMAGDFSSNSPPPHVLIEPQSVVVRESTDLLAIDDPLLRDAIRFIRDHASQPIRVRDVLGAVPISRRALERGFTKVLGRSPGTEIRRVHLEQAKTLLTDTHLAIPDVAGASGFRYVEHMIPVFRKEVGYTPLAYRKRMQGLGPRE